MSPGIKVFFFLFTLSGFSGLIYESIWTHYLKLFLGHAAYGQSLVLSIFMVGMSLGSLVASRYSERWSNLFRGYALAEGIVGIFALLFHPVFVFVISRSYEAVIPSLNSPVAVEIYKWVVAAALILPQSIFLGMTFPLLSAALLRRFPENPGRSLGLLYFTNSIGAAAGVLASGFFLIRSIGLPGTIALAGMLNLAIAAAVWFLASAGHPVRLQQIIREEERSSRAGISRMFLLITAFITGAASFIYEIGWIRMLSLVLGSSTHAFELMLSAFILGLALGGLWVQKRIEGLSRPVLFLSAVQVIMGLMAMATLFLYGYAFEMMQWSIVKLPKTEAGYMLFNLESIFLSLAVMLPATFCAGMTLPLITYILLKQGEGESSIGSVYAMNTIGAIAGVLFAIHIGMPLLGLKGLITAGAALDMGLGLFLLAAAVKTRENRKHIFGAAAFVCVCAAAFTLIFVRFDRHQMASGVYRLGKMLDPAKAEIIFHQDGKTATVSVVEHHEKDTRYRSIQTNGKPDASICTGYPHQVRLDETTMVLAAALPLAYRPDARTIANIGFGAGLTSHTFLLNPSITSLDTIEIERAMVEGARSFGGQNDLVYEDIRSDIYIDDAKTFFSSYGKKYDIIVSEPSNPWVSGVSGLFSNEFYGVVRRHLNEKGLFVQWFQLYEIDMNLVASVFKALSPHFSDFHVYIASYADLIIVARKEGKLDRLSPALFENPSLAEKLGQMQIEGMDDIEIRRVGDKKMLMPYFETFPLPANSDYYPVLDQNAARARFLSMDPQELFLLMVEPLPIVEMLSEIPYHVGHAANVTKSPFHPKTELVQRASALRDYFLIRQNNLDPETRLYAESVETIFYRCGSREDPHRRVALFNTAKNFMPYLTAAESEAVWKKLESGRCASSLTEVEKSYVSLFKAIGSRNGKRMAAEATYLLLHERDIIPERFNYVIAAGMLGHIADGNRTGAEALLRLNAERNRGPEYYLLSFLAAWMELNLTGK